MAPPSYRAYGSTGTISSNGGSNSARSHYSPAIYAPGISSHHDPGSASIWDDMMASSRDIFRRIRAYGSNGHGRHSAWQLLVRVGQQIRRNMVRRRLLSFPHLLVGLWVLVLLWGERWTFANKVNNCDWDHWEDWVSPKSSSLLLTLAS
jgi:hypothetical protein